MTSKNSFLGWMISTIKSLCSIIQARSRCVISSSLERGWKHHGLVIGKICQENSVSLKIGEIQNFRN